MTLFWSMVMVLQDKNKLTEILEAADADEAGTAKTACSKVT